MSWLCQALALPLCLCKCFSLCLTYYTPDNTSICIMIYIKSLIWSILFFFLFLWPESWTSKIFKENIYSSFTDFAPYWDLWHMEKKKKRFLWLLFLLNLLYFVYWNPYSCILDVLELTSIFCICFLIIYMYIFSICLSHLSKASFLILSFLLPFQLLQLSYVAETKLFSEVPNCPITKESCLIPVCSSLLPCLY